MENIINWIQQNWVGIVAGYLALHKLMVSIRDVLDKTPNTDDNAFEKTVTVMGKLATYLVTGKRPNA